MNAFVTFSLLSLKSGKPVRQGVPEPIKAVP
jgi:hypothetical protein